jgi:hypothetical protein
MDEGCEQTSKEPAPPNTPWVALPIRTSGLGRMGRRRRRMALVVTLSGLITFVRPLVSTDSKVLGRTDWSPLQILVALQAGTLPVQPYSSPREKVAFLGLDLLLGCGAVYFLLVVIAAAILAWPATRFVGFAAALGAVMMLETVRFEYPDLQDAIYGAPPAFVSGHRVHAGALGLILLGALVLLVYIAAHKGLD